jgi:NAD(P)-dependent dehydrogenase (short-subunit alcohol dehydrogenase family)
MLLKGKTAIITGAASGIGRATARLFAREGANVVIADIDAAGGAAAADEILRDGGNVIFIKTDVARMDDHAELVRSTLNQYERLDIVYSNAGVVRPGSATELSEEDWDLTLNINLKAAWMLAKFAIPPMLEQGGGVFLITSSIQGIQGLPGFAAYQAAKGGLIALTRSLAADYAPRIRVNAILPGGVATGMMSHLSEGQRVARAERVPLRRNAEPEDIAQTALFLASDMSAFVTGQSIIVDGGRTSMELYWPQ